MVNDRKPSDRYAGLDDPRFAELDSAFVDMDGEPMSVRDWAIAYEDLAGRTLAECEIIGRAGSQYVQTGIRAVVRTVWTGTRDEAGLRPFGTAVGGGTNMRVLQEYDTKAEALAGHACWATKLAMS